MSDIIEELDKHLEPADPTEETPPQEEETPAAEAETVEDEDTAAEDDIEDPTIGEEEPEPKLLAGKYKTPEELEQAYAELQKTLGTQGSELGALRDEISKLSERIPEQDEDQYVPMDDSTVNWFDTLMDENPVQAMEWARQNDPSGAYYNRGLEQWFDQNPRAASTYQLATVVNGLRDEFTNTLTERTQPYERQSQQQTIQRAWQIAAGENPDIANHADEILQEAKDSPEILRGAETAEEQAARIHKLYRLVRGAAAASLETAAAEAETEQKQSNRAAKLSGTSPQTKAVTPEPDKDPGEQWLDDIGFNDYLDRQSAA